MNIFQVNLKDDPAGDLQKALILLANKIGGEKINIRPVLIVETEDLDLAEILGVMIPKIPVKPEPDSEIIRKAHERVDERLGTAPAAGAGGKNKRIAIKGNGHRPANYRISSQKRLCKNCGEEFDARQSGQVYCKKHECRKAKWREDWAQKKVEVKAATIPFEEIPLNGDE